MPALRVLLAASFDKSLPKTRRRHWFRQTNMSVERATILSAGPVGNLILPRYAEPKAGGGGGGGG